MGDAARTPPAIVEREGLTQVSDEGALAALVAEVVAASPEQAASYRAGQDRRARLVRRPGDERTGGRANPQLVNALLRKALEADPR